MSEQPHGCICQHPPEGVIGWDRGMVNRDCPQHGHEALPEQRDPQMEKVIEAVQGAREQSNATRAMMSLDLLLEGAEEAIDEGGMLDPVSVKAIVLRGLAAAREDTERPDALEALRRIAAHAGEPCRNEREMAQLLVAIESDALDAVRDTEQEGNGS